MAIPGYDLNRDRYPGLDRTRAGLGGSIPQHTITGHTVFKYKRLYKSLREIALLRDKTFRAGYGVLEIGTVLAVDNNTGDCYPYIPDAVSRNDVGRIFLIANNDTNANLVVDYYESFKLRVGDVIKVNDDGSVGAEDGEIDSITRNVAAGTATITLTGATGGAYTVANDANIYLKGDGAGGAALKGSNAAYILEMEVDTGGGPDAKGGLGSVLMSNAVIYQDACVNMDGQARTDLGNVTADTPYYIVR